MRADYLGPSEDSPETSQKDSTMVNVSEIAQFGIAMTFQGFRDPRYGVRGGS